MLKNKWENILNNAKVNEDDRAWLDAIFDRMVKAEKKVETLEKQVCVANGWELENFRQEQRDNFHGDGQW